MTNKDIARNLRRTARLMAINGENSFKVRAYEKAADNVRQHRESISRQVQEGRELEIEGVGKAIAGALRELVETGTYDKLERLREEIPEGVIELSEVPGIGPKKLETLWKEIGITSIEELLKACESGKLLEYKGFGEKTQSRLYNAVLYYDRNRNKMHLSTAREFDAQLREEMGDPLSKQLLPTGSFYRNCPTLQGLQYVFPLDQQAQLTEKLRQHQRQIKAPDATTLEIALDKGFTARVQLAAAERMANEQLAGSLFGEHLEALQPHLAAPAATEAELYERAGLPFIPPELRENTGELQLAREDRLPDLLELSQLQGILHAHSTYSDGKATLENMAQACIERGYHYLGITDHSQSAFYANGLKPERVLKQQKEIEKLNKKLAPFRIFSGIESDILPDGRLDYTDEVLASFDFVIASVHSGFQMDEAKATQRLVTAIENPFTTILGHPTGRLLLNREGYPINHRKVIDAAAANGVAIEVNANPWRLDLDWTWIPYALEKGVYLAICPDGHSTEGIDDVYYGTAVARKGRLTPSATLNTLSAQALEDYFARRKAGHPQHSQQTG